MQEGTKLQEQRRAAVLLMEALREFAERAQEEKVNLLKPLEVKSEIYAFQATEQDALPLKKMSAELGEKERIDVADRLASTPGSKTTDFIPLEAIYNNINEDDKKKIAEGELKKIIMVFTDGESNDAVRVQNSLERLRKAGVITVAVGITKDGKTALTTYAPDGRLAEKAEDLLRIMAEALKEHLADV